MPPDQLTSEYRAGPPEPTLTGDPTDEVAPLESAVLALLIGTPPASAADDGPIPVATLQRAAARYRAAGRAALTLGLPHDWLQFNITFPDGHDAERTVTTWLWSRLRFAETSGVLASWWYVRKTPTWRLRVRADEAHREALHAFVTGLLDDLIETRFIATWSEVVYEPEVYVFGGPEAMDVAHRFFHADSSNILAYLRCAGTGRKNLPVPGRRELSLLQCTALLRGAGQDWHEQGDVWCRVARMRPLPRDGFPGRIDDLAGKVRPLVALDVQRAEALTDPKISLPHVRPWLGAATDAGHALGDLARNGNLRRGLRDVLAHHVIFHWNRLGLADTAQAALAHAAAAAMLNSYGSDHGLRRIGDVAQA